MEERVSIEGIDPAVLLVELVKGTQPIGMGRLQAAAFGREFNIDDAKKCLDGAEKVKWFDYVAGRPIKVDIDTAAKTVGGVWLYDRDAGEGAFMKALERARAAK